MSNKLKQKLSAPAAPAPQPVAPQTYALPANVFNAIITYLAKRPWDEVANLQGILLAIKQRQEQQASATSSQKQDEAAG